MRKLILLILVLPLMVFSQSRILGPYLQDAEPTSIVVMWETNNSTDSKLSYGLTPALGSEASGSAVTGVLNTRIHRVKLENLSPGTVYYYSVNFGNSYSDTVIIKTPPLPSAEQSFGMVAMSDMQRDAARPDKFRQVVENGVLEYANTLPGNSVAEKYAYILVPGDLVSISLEIPSNTYDIEFFEPGKQLFDMVPVYPVLGNHEYIGTATPFFKYFDLPKNGTDGFMEHWWYKDYSNTRIIGLQSNVSQIQANGGLQKQLDWLEAVLDSACMNDDIDFVFAQIHHPFHSEMWTPGNENYTGGAIELLEDFSSTCGKPSIHFFGHTHSYARGQSKDHKHLMVNVASAGGALDKWGDGDDRDYEEYSKGISDYGFVYLSVEAGVEPKFTLKRISRGSNSSPLNNEVRDSIVIYKNDQVPNKPVAISPINGTISPDCIVLQGSLFGSSKPESEHGESQWQLSLNCNDFSSPLIDVWKNYENIVNGVNLQAGDDLTDQDISGLAPNTTYCWRVRYRNKNLEWSDWSNPASFTTGTPINLLLNPGAELGTQNWTVQNGAIESLGVGECDGDEPYAGSKYFCVGAACNGNANATAYQIVDVSNFEATIDAGNKMVSFGGYLSDFSNFDLPQFRIEFLDGSDNALGQTPKFGGRHNAWRSYDKQALIPQNTRKIKFYLFGTRGLFGSANDSYFDELYMVIDSFAGHIDTAICNGQTITIFDEVITSPGTYIIEDPSVMDCVNEYEVIVSAGETSSTVINQEICEGDSFQVGALYFSEEGTFTITLSSSSGCDSIIELNLAYLDNSDCATSIGQHYVDDLIEFYPNPFKTEAIMKLKYLPSDQLELKLFNDIGELMKVYPNINTNEIQIKGLNLAAGLYFYILDDNGKVYYRGNFVVED